MTWWPDVKWESRVAIVHHSTNIIASGNETGLGPETLTCNSAKLAPGHTSPQATKYKETVLQPLQKTVWRFLKKLGIKP